MLRWDFSILFILLLIVHIDSHPVEKKQSGNGIKQVKKMLRKNDGTETKQYRRYQGKNNFHLRKQASEFISKFNYVREKTFFVNISRVTGNKETGNDTTLKSQKTRKNKQLRILSKSKTIENGVRQLNIDKDNYLRCDTIATFMSWNGKDINTNPDDNKDLSENSASFSIAFNVAVPYKKNLKEYTKVFLYLPKDDAPAHVQACFCQIRVLEKNESVVVNKSSESNLEVEVKISDSKWSGIDITSLARHWDNSSSALFNVAFKCKSDSAEIQLPGNLDETSKENYCIPNLVKLHLQDREPFIVLCSFKRDENVTIKTENCVPKMVTKIQEQNINIQHDFTKDSINVGLEGIIKRNNISREKELENSVGAEMSRLNDLTKRRSKRSADRIKSRFKRRADPKRKHRRLRWMKKVSCRRHRLYVDFASINYQKIIVYPKGYQAYQCVGTCYNPISQHLTPTLHAAIQNQVHVVEKGRAPRACCVPTKLKPLSVIYEDAEKGTGKIKSRWANMVVAECGCR